ncbi:PleD family two-component system response regulator [Aureimonas sp. SA4125]|uniref:PleD family two-component system response regulator n=1 Tax=Aureimonas sp. SA4125 TaxID=2826993 RepID=UPI001CC4A374|nr:PleD family two-component system response regulator [Aureimonas sp. SA4125]BDA84472.1 PleD family two-component system response regulator [Aureimonas sp. SA4125]
MTARILVVDDMDINLRLMEARLAAEYFEVLTARSGAEAIEICERETIDIVLLDVMMPDLDGYEVCRRLKQSPRTRHLPIVLITSLDQPADRVAGLDAGADDFLTKPVRDLQLFSRVRSLVRLKILTDELRIRAETTVSLVARNDLLGQLAGQGMAGRLLVFDDDAGIAARIKKILQNEHQVDSTSDPAAALHAEQSRNFDLFIVNLATASYDALRLCSQIRSSDALRQVPILLVSDSADEARTAKALELGANDYLANPLDRNELLARVRTQIKRKRYDEGLRQSLRETIALAVTDPLTGLNNRRFLESHLPTVIERARKDAKPLSVLMADIDHFKRINDGWGHDAGDRVLKEFAARLKHSLRASDLACRFGGEEFVVLMPEADGRTAQLIAERLRSMVADQPFDISGESISVTVSVGVAVLDAVTDDWETLLKRADRGLYAAKRNGRNQVIALAA